MLNEIPVWMRGAVLLLVGLAVGFGAGALFWFRESGTLRETLEELRGNVDGLERALAVAEGRAEAAEGTVNRIKEIGEDLAGTSDELAGGIGDSLATVDRIDELVDGVEAILGELGLLD